MAKGRGEKLHQFADVSVSSIRQVFTLVDGEVHDGHSTARGVSHRTAQVMVTVRLGRHRLTGIHGLEQVLPVESEQGVNFIVLHLEVCVP